MSAGNRPERHDQTYQRGARCERVGEKNESPLAAIGWFDRSNWPWEPGSQGFFIIDTLRQHHTAPQVAQVVYSRLSKSCTSFDRKRWQLNRVIFTCLPSWIHCSAYPAY